MPVIVVANPKGGVGKSTLATQIAGLYARQGHPVMLGDVDRQQSSRQWLALRPVAAAPIKPWDLVGDTLRAPKGVTHMVLDTPAGMHDKLLDAVMRIADRILIPLQPSLFDIQATHAFVNELHEHNKRGRDLKIALVGMRVKEHTISNDQLHQFLAKMKLPVLGYLRDTQNYVHLAARGLTLWDIAPGRVERDLEQWQPLAAWLNA
jgi:chromosome partitioning protein